MDKVLNVFQTVGGIVRRHPKKSVMVLIFVGSTFFGWNLSPEKQTEILNMLSTTTETTSDAPVVPVAPAR